LKVSVAHAQDSKFHENCIHECGGV
jgi:hypothetical protein